MANQDQQNCTDNATIEEEDKMHKVDSSSTSSNLSLKPLNEMALDEISESVVALDEISEPMMAMMCPPPSFYRTTPYEKEPSFYRPNFDKYKACCPWPSFYRRTHDEKQGITKDEQFVMPRGNYFVAKPVVSTDDIIVLLEDDMEIPEELAVCLFCFEKLIVQEIMMKTKCGCKDALAHESCALNKKCHSCGKNVYKIKVTLLIKTNSIEDSKEKPGKKWKMFSLFKF